MSKFYAPPLYTPKGLENQLKNTIFNAHDLCCGCPEPAKHLEFLFSTEKCHHSGEITVRTGGETGADDPIEEGILQKMFEEDFTENDAR